MEEATTRGKLVFLDDGRERQRSLKGIKIEIWTSDEKHLLHSTRTDDLGFFDLPHQPVGEYVIGVGALRLKLKVYEAKPIADNLERAPKLLLIMVPPDVI